MKNSSNRYIAMCTGAVSIQNEKYKDGKFVLESGDWFYRGEDNVKNGVRYPSIISIPFRAEKDELASGQAWLPTQRQLQDLVGIEIVKKYVKHTTIDASLDFNRFVAFQGWVDNLSNEGHYYATSMQMLTWTFEEMWLCFLMEERYGLVWNETQEKWVFKRKK